MFCRLKLLKAAAIERRDAWHINSYTKSVRNRKANSYPKNPYGWFARVVDNGVLNAAAGIGRTRKGK